MTAILYYEVSQTAFPLLVSFKSAFLQFIINVDKCISKSLPLLGNIIRNGSRSRYCLTLMIIKKISQHYIYIYIYIYMYHSHDMAT